MKKILILGTGGLGKECYYYLKDTFGSDIQIEFYSNLDTKDILNIKKRKLKVHKNYQSIDPSIHFIAAVGNPTAKKSLVLQAIKHGLRPASTLIHPQAFVQNPEKIGMGGIIAPGAVVAADAIIGDYILLNYNSTIGHDSSIGDFCTINPSVNISGNNKIGNCVFIGVGAVTKQSIKIGDDVVCGAQACCLQDIDANTTVVGVPANRHLKK